MRIVRSRANSYIQPYSYSYKLLHFSCLITARNVIKCVDCFKMSGVPEYAEVSSATNESFKIDKNACYSGVSEVTVSKRKGNRVKGRKKSYLLTILVILFVMVLILAAALVSNAFTLVEISKLKSETATGKFSSFPITSCAALPPNSPSDYYWVRNSIGSAVRVYCDMTRSCGGVTGGWMRVAELDMTDSSQQCPSGLRQRTDDNTRTCVRNSNSAGCSSVTLPTSNIHYSRVCGRIIAYQFGATNAFEPYSINFAYVDGVSLTHGNPRQHIWTFAAALDESGTGNASSYCHCTGGSQAFRNITPPSFVSNNYFCDTGSQQHMDEQPPQFYSADPLWDGAGCGSGNTCCTFNTPPWFYKQLPDPTTDDIEMRVCSNDLARYEDTAIEVMEIYIQEPLEVLS